MISVIRTPTPTRRPFITRIEDRLKPGRPRTQPVERRTPGGAVRPATEAKDHPRGRRAGTEGVPTFADMTTNPTGTTRGRP